MGSAPGGVGDASREYARVHEIWGDMGGYGEIGGVPSESPRVHDVAAGPTRLHGP